MICHPAASNSGHISPNKSPATNAKRYDDSLLNKANLVPILPLGPSHLKSSHPDPQGHKHPAATARAAY